MLPRIPSIWQRDSQPTASGKPRAVQPVTGSRAKKTGHAVEQDRADVLSQREAWFDGRLDLDPSRLAFIDET